ncbi:hypothetical protein, partial [Chryseobacterium sp. CH25]|uniref:hypothetical protein n=1 Tax=Chryseobacterium sp. CH25 TaxID=713559 RepID=UPI00102773AA
PYAEYLKMVGVEVTTGNSSYHSGLLKIPNQTVIQPTPYAEYLKMVGVEVTTGNSSYHSGLLKIPNQTVI